MIMMIVAGMIFLALRGSRALNRGQQPQQLGAGPVRYGETPLGDAARASLDADITRFGDELRDLDLDVVGIELSEEARANYSEALDAYENAKQAMNQARYESDATAIALARDNALNIIFFNLSERGNIGRVVQGEPIGTFVSR